MHPHCELAVQQILPAVRSLMASHFRGKELSQQKIAELLMITQPAVSKYLRQIRAKQTLILKQDAEVYQKIKDAAEHILLGHNDPHQFCEICDLVRKKKLVCGQCAFSQLCTKIKEEPKVMKYGYQ